MPEEAARCKRRLSSFQIIILGFAGVILLGALLLMLPLSTTAGCVTPFHEALFTATSAVCVTGLVVQTAEVAVNSASWNGVTHPAVVESGSISSNAPSRMTPAKPNMII